MTALQLKIVLDALPEFAVAIGYMPEGDSKERAELALNRLRAMGHKAIGESHASIADRGTPVRPSPVRDHFPAPSAELSGWTCDRGHPNHGALVACVVCGLARKAETSVQP